MRTAFIRTLTDLASRDDRINLIVGDLGFGVIEPFADTYPRQFTNAGVAEQNMTGVAAGMALCGKIVFTYSIANFPTLRCLEQIRNDVCYHNVNVKVVSVGGGLGYGSLGVTHHATEDIAVMRSLPNMTVVAPGDAIEVELATRALAAQPGPAYLRLGRSGEPRVHHSEIDFQIGKAITVREGEDVCLIAAGGLLFNAIESAELLSRKGIEARVLSMHTIKPLDIEAILAATRETQAIFTIEEHSILGGLGSAVAEVLAESAERKVVFKRLGLPPTFTNEVGNQDYLLSKYSLSPQGILATLEPILEPLVATNR
jgi:transketolase